MSNLSAESSIVHKEDVKVFNVVDEELFKAVGEMESGFFIVTVADFGHGFVASESASHSVVDTWDSASVTSGSSPAGGQSSSVEVRLEPSETGSSLMGDSFSQQGC